MISRISNDQQNTRLTVRPLALEDLDGYIAYFTQFSKVDAERMGLAIDRVPSMANRMLKKIGFPLVLTHVAASSELSVVCELNRYEILRDVAERYALVHVK